MKAFLTTLLCGSAQAVELQSGYALADDIAPPPAPAVVTSTVWYHGTDAAAGGGDNIVGTTAAITAFAAKEKAAKFGPGAPFLKEAGAGDAPLKSFFSESLQDTLTTASTEGLAWASDPAHGYKFMQIEGYCSAKADPGGADELVQYWSAGRNDSYIVAKGSSDENSAKSAK
jgi:hypothetical protein